MTPNTAPPDMAWAIIAGATGAVTLVGAIAAAFGLWTNLRRPHVQALAGFAMMVAGTTGLSFSLYCQQPSLVLTHDRHDTFVTDEKIIAAVVRDHQARTEAWEARPERHWLRPLWPACIVVTLAGVTCMAYGLSTCTRPAQSG